MCLCKIICEGCASPLTKCEDCRSKFKQDTMFSNFHKRIASEIYKPCKHRRLGCGYKLTPDDEHETSCEYLPVECAKCKELISKKHMTEHIDKEHFLTRNNQDVKFADFYLEATGSRKLKCITNRGHNLYISLLSVDSVVCNMFILEYQGSESTISIKLDFHKDEYSHSCSKKELLKSSDGQAGMSTIDVDKKVFNDWVNGENILNIEVTDRKKWQRKRTPINEAVSEV